MRLKCARCSVFSHIVSINFKYSINIKYEMLFFSTAVFWPFTLCTWFDHFLWWAGKTDRLTGSRNSFDQSNPENIQQDGSEEGTPLRYLLFVC